MTDSRYSLERRELLQTTAAAGVAGALALSGVSAGAASDRRTQQEAPDEDEYETILEEMDGDGSQESPYVVTDLVELQAINGDLQSFYDLGADIDGSPTAEWNDGAGFQPLGLKDDKYKSIFDGKEHEIRNIVVNRPETDVTGVFGWMRGKVSNLTVTNTDVTGSRSVGVVCGTNQGILKNISARGTATGEEFVGGLAGTNAARVVDSTAESTVTGEERVGGFCGTNVGAVSNSTADSDVTGTSFVGGFAGFNNKNVRNVSTAGSVEGEVKVGGVAGESSGNIDTAQSEVTVTGNEKVGGVVGENVGPLRGAKAVGEVTGTKIVGGVVGKNWARLVGAVTEGTVSGDTAAGGIAGWNLAGGEITSTLTLGEVSGGEGVGALVGRHGWEFQGEGESAHLRDSYWNGDTISLDAVGNNVPGDGETTVKEVTGLSPDQMRGESATSNMSGLNFERVWRVIPDEYPRLRAFTPAEITIAELSSQSLAVRQDQMVSLSVTLENSGEWGGVRDVVFSVGGEGLLQQTVTLNPGGSQTIEFRLDGGRLPVGDHQFTVSAGRDQQQGTLTIQSGSTLGDGDGDGGDDDDTETPADDDGSSSDGSGPGFGIGGAVAGLGGAYLAARRLLDRE